MALPPLLLLLACLASCHAAPAGTFASFGSKKSFRVSSALQKQKSARVLPQRLEALYSDYSYDSGTSFFDSDLFSNDYDFPTDFPSDFPSNFPTDSGLGGDTGFSINGICDSFCQEAESEVNQFEQNVRDFEAKFGGNSGNAFPAVGGGSFPVSGVVPTPRPHARPRNTPFTVRPTQPNTFTARPGPEPTPFTAFPRPTRFPVTRQPTARPNVRPTVRITARPTARPTARKTARPTARQTARPTARTQPPAPRAPARPTTGRPPPTTTDRAFRLSPTLRSTPELPKAASLPEVTTSNPVVWSFKGETLGGGVQPGRAGRTQATESPDSATDGSLPINSFFSSGDALVDPEGGRGDGAGFPVFDAVPK